MEVLVGPGEVEEFKAKLEASGVVYEVFSEDVAKVVRDSLAQQSRARILPGDGTIFLKHFPRYDEVC